MTEEHILVRYLRDLESKHTYGLEFLEGIQKDIKKNERVICELKAHMREVGLLPPEAE